MDPNDLPSIQKIRATGQSLAMLDAILSPEWQYRYFSFDSKWGPEMEMASMRNGCGDDWHLLFDSVGAALKGFAHELANDFSFPSRLRTEVPDDFASFINEPAFSMESATFCYWRKVEDTAWNKVRSLMPDDGAAEMLYQIVAGPAEYKNWAEDYFEVSVDLQHDRAVGARQPAQQRHKGALRAGHQPYQDLARHYEVAVLSARARKPKDKAKVENGVPVVARWVWHGCAANGSSAATNSIACCANCSQASEMTPDANQLNLIDF